MANLRILDAAIRSKMPALNLCTSNVTQGEKILGVARHTLSRLINGQAGISPEMAIRLEKAGWSNANHWLRRQTAFDLAEARQNEGAIKVKRYVPEELSMR